jgi:hypothetical protein
MLKLEERQKKDIEDLHHRVCGNNKAEIPATLAVRRNNHQLCRYSENRIDKKSLAGHPCTRQAFLHRENIILQQ